MKLRQGKVVSLPLVATLQAADYSAAGHITPAPLPNNLGVKVEGINPNWDAGLYDADKQVLRRISVFEGAGYFTADISKSLNFGAGNLLLANNPDIHLHLFAANGQTAQIKAHNPTAHPVQVKIWGNPQIGWLSPLQTTLYLNSGEEKTMALPLTHAMRWTEAGVRPATGRMLRMGCFPAGTPH